MNFFFFFFFFTSCDRRFVEKSPVNSFISCKKIWLPSRITSQPFERDRPSDAVINLLDRISRKIFRVTCIPTQRLVPTYNIRFGFKASNRGRKTNPRRESAGRKRFNSMKSRHERVFFPSSRSFHLSTELAGTRNRRENRSLERERAVIANVQW